MTGMVLAFVLVRSAAKKYSFQHSTNESCDHAGQGDWQNDAEESAPYRAAINQGCLFKFIWDRVKLVTHDPDYDGQHRQRINEDEPDDAVEQGQFLVEHEKWHGQDHRRQDELRQEKEGDILVPPRTESIWKAAQSIGRQRADNHRKQRRAHRDQHAVSETQQKFITDR
jgi:hypothetical protein